MIETVEIGTSRCEGGASIRMYSYGENEQMTLGQLMNALCCRTGMVLEDLAVNKTNLIVRGTRRLDALAEMLEQIALDATYESVLTAQDYEGMTYRDFIVNELGCEIDGIKLPATLSSYADRMQLYDAIKENINAFTTQNQQDLVDLQIDISRRDVAYTIARSTVATLGGVLQETAENFS